MGNKPYREDRAILEVSSKRQKIKSKRTKELNAFMCGLDGAGKSTILYKHIARSTYASTCMTIPQTITYNVETIRPKISFNTQSKQYKKIKPPMAPIPPPINSIHSSNNQSQKQKQNQKRKQLQKRRKSEVIKSMDSIMLNIYDFGGNKPARELWTNFKQLKIKKLENTNNKIDFIILVVDCTDLKRLNENNDENNDCVQLAMKKLLNMKRYLHIPLLIFANKQDLNGAISSTVLPYKLGIKQITIWNLISNVKYCYNINLEYKISKTVLSYLPNNNYYWNMNKRHWNIFDTNGIKKNCNGINNGIQWLYNEYYINSKVRNNKNIQKNGFSFNHGFKMTM